MYPKKLDQLSAEELAVIEYLYALSNPPSDPLPLAERAVRGLSHFLLYVVEVAAHEPGMLSILQGRSIDDELGIYRTEEALFRHVLEVVMQKVLVDDKHTPDTHRYTTPLLWPPAGRGDVPAYMPRFNLYMHLCALVFGGIEDVNTALEKTIGRDAVAQLRSAIRKHYRRGSRGRKS